MRVHNQPAYVLLNRPYSETSWIVEVFSVEYGRLALMAKGARREKSKLKGVLLPFQPVLLSWVGKGEVPTLTSAEIDQELYDFAAHDLAGDALVCGFYCNELIVNLLHRHDPHPGLFDRYQHTIMALNNDHELNDPPSVHRKPSTQIAYSLRDFEKAVMRETGYEVSFEYEAGGRTLIESDGYYYFQPSQGFVRIANNYTNKAVQGRIIQAMALDESELSTEDLSKSKHLMRDILTQILGSKKIVSRELFFPKGAR